MQLLVYKALEKSQAAATIAQVGNSIYFSLSLSLTHTHTLLPGCESDWLLVG